MPPNIRSNCSPRLFQSKAEVLVFQRIDIRFARLSDEKRRNPYWQHVFRLMRAVTEQLVMENFKEFENVANSSRDLEELAGELNNVLPPLWARLEPTAKKGCKGYLKKLTKNQKVDKTHRSLIKLYDSLPTEAIPEAAPNPSRLEVRQAWEEGRCGSRMDGEYPHGRLRMKNRRDWPTRFPGSG